MIVKLELNTSDKVILCSGDTTATYRLSNIPLEYDVIFDEIYATILSQLSYTLIRYTNLTSTHYQTLSKKTYQTFARYNLSARSLQSLFLLFLDKHDETAKKYEHFYNSNIHKVLVTFGILYYLFSVCCL